MKRSCGWWMIPGAVLLALSAVTTRRIGLFDSLDGFGSLEAQADLAVSALTCVDGGTIKSQAAQSYTQYVPLHDVDSARSLLPPGHSELPDSPLKTSTAQLWQKGELHPSPLSRQAVEKIAFSHRTLGPGQATTTARIPESGDAAVVSTKE